MNSSNFKNDRIKQALALLGLEDQWKVGTVVVSLEEEYGYRWWFWITNINADELEKFWKSIESIIPYFNNPSQPDNADSLPGILFLYDCLNESHKMARNLFASVADYEAHIHWDDDSYLRKTVYIYHSGYESQ